MTTYIQAAATSRPLPYISPQIRSVARIVAGSLLIALCAQIKIPLFFTPVALSLQTLAILLIGCTFSTHEAVLTTLLYTAEGAAGLPFFIGGGSGLAHLMSPTAGYLFGFTLQAFLVGKLRDLRAHPSFSYLLASCLIGCFAQMILGICWLSNFTGWKNVLLCGFYPFVLGEIAKSSIVATMIKVFSTKAK